MTSLNHQNIPEAMQVPNITLYNAVTLLWRTSGLHRSLKAGELMTFLNSVSFKLSCLQKVLELSDRA